MWTMSSRGFAKMLFIIMFGIVLCFVFVLIYRIDKLEDRITNCCEED
jgi:hypothetical protein